MAENGNGTTVATPDELKAKLSELNDKLAEMAMDASMAIDAKLAAGQKIITEAKKVQSQITGMADTAEAEAREELHPTIVDALQDANWADAMAECSITGTYKRDEAGEFTDLVLTVTISDHVTDLFHSVFPVADCKALTSVRGVKFSIGPESTEVEYTGGARKGGGGGGGKGWVAPDGGEKMRLGEAFDRLATAAQQEELKAVQGNGNDEYKVKKTVVKAAGYKQAE